MSKVVETLRKELERRTDEVAEYDLNIKLHSMAIAVAKTKENSEEFQAQLETLLAQTKAERLKSEIMLITVQELLNDLEVDRREH